jgi:hypothetical protein
MADGLAFAEAPEPKRATEWLERTRALRGEIERVDDALSQAEESVRLNPRRLRFVNPAAGLRDGVDTLERAATDMRVLARSVADSARIDSEHSPIREAETRGRLGAVLAELSAAVRAYGQLLEAEPVPSEHADRSGHSGHVGRSGRSGRFSRFSRFGRGGLAGFAGLAGLAGLTGREGRAGQASFATEPLTGVLEDHLEEAGRQQDRLADLLQADPTEQPEGWALRGEILAHVDRLRSELQPGRLPGQIDDRSQVRQPLRALRDRRRDARAPSSRDELGGRARRTAARVRGERVRGRVRARVRGARRG